MIAKTLIDLDPRYPSMSDAARRELQEVKALLEAQAPEGAAPDPFEAAERAGRDDGRTVTARP